MKRFYTVESWALIVLGAAHIGSAFRFFSTFSSQSLWFVSGGVLMVLVGALNLLNRAYGRQAPGLRLVCIAANIAITAFAVATGILSGASLVQWIIVLGIVVPLTLLSFARAVNETEGASSVAGKGASQ